MSDAIPIGSILVTYMSEGSGDITTSVTVEGDIPVVTQVGLLEMAKDTILSGEMEADQ